jgi:O-antigen/teichoic acid export membrane protein
MSRLTRNVVWMSLGQGFRLLIQALYFVVIARSLGAANYGAFVGVVALVGIVFPFATLGSGNLLIKNVARDANLFAVCYGRALATTGVTSCLLFLAVLWLSHFVLPDSIPLRLVVLVAASDLFGLSLIQLCSQAFQAFERLTWTAAINVMGSVSRLTGALILVAMQRHPSALQWGYLYFSSTWVVAVPAMLLVLVKLGVPNFKAWKSVAEIREGIYFSAGSSAQTIYNDIDKTMLARLGTLEAAGIYGAAYRLIDVTFVPIQSLLAATYPNFFRTGAAGISAALGYARRLVWGALAYSFAACLAILVFAGVVPLILGPEYAFAAEALRWLSLLPVLKVLHYLVSDSLTGSGYQAVRTGIQVGVALFNVLINLWIIPAYSWRGAAWSSIASDTLLVCCIGAAAIVLSRRARTVRLDASLESA